MKYVWSRYFRILYIRRRLPSAFPSLVSSSLPCLPPFQPFFLLTSHQSYRSGRDSPDATFLQPPSSEKHPPPFFFLIFCLCMDRLCVDPIMNYIFLFHRSIDYHIFYYLQKSYREPPKLCAWDRTQGGFLKGLSRLWPRERSVHKYLLSLPALPHYHCSLNIMYMSFNRSGNRQRIARGWHASQRSRRERERALYVPNVGNICVLCDACLMILLRIYETCLFFNIFFQLFF